MEKKTTTRSQMPWWAKVAGIVLVTAASMFASQHPHTLIYHLVKFIIAPVP